MIDEQAKIEGFAILKSNGYRTERPKKQRSRSRGHGAKPNWKERLRDKREPERVARLAVPEVKLPDFLLAALRKRPEARSHQTVEEYLATKAQG